MKPLGASDPTTVGRYRILAELGRGGMGRVLLGSGPDGRLVAVKLVHGVLVQDEGFRVRFRREVEASRKVSGAYTAAVVEADAGAEVPWLASVFVPGPSLHDAVAMTGPLPEESALRLAAGLATALLEIHRVGLVHRDLKPSNVLLTDDGLRVIDFGIAKAVDDPGGNLTHTGSMIGSPGFMSPEQIEAGTVGPASDVFALGAVLAAACIGRSPFTGTSTLQTLNNVVNVRPDLSALPPRVRLIVELCLEKDPNRRPGPEKVIDLAHPVPPSVRPWLPGVHWMIDDQRAAVARFLPGGPGSEPPTERSIRPVQPRPNPTSLLPADARVHTGYPAPTAPPARRGPRWAVVAVAAAAVVALLAGGAVVWQKWPLSATASGESAQPSPSTTTTTTSAATSPPKPAPTTGAAARQELRLYWNSAFEDNATCVTEGCLGRHRAGYSAPQAEGRVLTSREEGTVPLKTFWNEERGDLVTCGTAECARSQEQAGYVFISEEGFAYTSQRAGTVPLRLFWHDGRKDNATCVSDKCVNDQKSVGYQYIRDEGFVYPAKP